MQTRIYLVEHSPLVLKWLTEAIEDMTGAKVVGSASDQHEASIWLNEHEDWDVAVLDLQFAQGSALQILRRIYKMPEQKIVVLSDYPTQLIRQLCISAGADAFFDKSTDFEVFTDYVKNEVTLSGPMQS